MTTSLILTMQEWQYALTGEGDVAQLCEKGFAKRDESGAIAVGPELRLIVEEYSSANIDEITAELTALRGKRFCMLIEPYPLIRETLKISLFKDNAALSEALVERGFEDGKTSS